MTPCTPLTYLLSEKKIFCCQLCSTHYAAVQINNCIKRTSAIKVVTMKITDNFHFEWKPSYTTKSTLFMESKDEWDTNEGTSKSMKNALHVQWYDKRHLLG